MSRASLIEEMSSLGFQHHHAQGSTANLNLWLRQDTPSKVPEYATHLLQHSHTRNKHPREQTSSGKGFMWVLIYRPRLCSKIQELPCGTKTFEVVGWCFLPIWDFGGLLTIHQRFQFLYELFRKDLLVDVMGQALIHQIPQPLWKTTIVTISGRSHFECR